MDNTEIFERLQQCKGVEWGGSFFNPDTMHRRLLERVIALETIRAEDISKVNQTFGQMYGITIIDVDGTGWLAADTPIGRIGNYVTMVALLGAIIFAYQNQLRRTPEPSQG